MYSTPETSSAMSQLCKTDTPQLPNSVMQALFAKTETELTEERFYELYQVKTNEDNLFLINYRKTMENKPVEGCDKTVRGWVMDARGNVIVRGFPFTPTMTDPGDFSGVYKFLPHGTTVRFFKRDGKVMISTFGSLDFSKSQWGGHRFQELFDQILNESGYPCCEEFGNMLFNELPNSDIVHVFVLNHHLITPSCPNNYDDFICYLGAYPQNNPDYLGRDDVDFVSRWSLNVEGRPYRGLIPHYELSTEEVEAALGQGSGVLLVDGLQAYRILSDRMLIAEKVIENCNNLKKLICDKFNFVFPSNYYDVFDISKELTLVQKNCTLLERAISPVRRNEMRQVIQEFFERRENVFEMIVSLYKQNVNFLKELEDKCTEKTRYVNADGRETVNGVLAGQFNRCLGRLRTVLKFANNQFDYDPSKQNASEGVLRKLRTALNRENASSLYTMLWKLPF